jgi:hypothetical protein
MGGLGMKLAANVGDQERRWPAADRTSKQGKENGGGKARSLCPFSIPLGGAHLVAASEWYEDGEAVEE